jgi:predicted ArsR family transcriptional regulator
MAGESQPDVRAKGVVSRLARRRARDYLLEALRRDGKVIAKDVAADLGLSEDSVRRDLRELAAEGLCHRRWPAEPWLWRQPSRSRPMRSSWA